MLGPTAPAAATLDTSTSSATSASPARPSRLRGLSYLRSYTREHLSNTSSATPVRLESPPLVRSTSSPAHTFRTTRPPSDPEASGPSVSQDETSPLTQEPLLSGTDNADQADPRVGATAVSMTRARATSAANPPQHPSTTSILPHRTDPVGPQTSVETENALNTTSSAGAAQPAATIRFIPHIETRTSRPSLQFAAISRTLKDQNSIVRVGRYSDRDGLSPEKDAHLVGFKSKVVSRRHCEFWCTNGQWYIKDVKSSSGTFLNHVRLSAPGIESRPFPVKDGDVVQLGIDFKGGEEIIFRCVKIRIECNRGWQKSLNNFNTSAHRRILQNALGKKSRDSDAASVNSSECSICLNPVSPCQALFVAPCSHVWHYKCIRNLIHTPSYPNFLCPNCRLVADLDADVEPPEGDLNEDLEVDLQNPGPQSENGSAVDEDDENPTAPNLRPSSLVDSLERATGSNQESTNHTETRVSEYGDVTIHESVSETASSVTRPIQIATSSVTPRDIHDLISARSMTPTSHSHFALTAGSIPHDLMTPRNEEGPFVLDGGGSRDPQTTLAQLPVPEEVEPSSPS